MKMLANRINLHHISSLKFIRNALLIDKRLGFLTLQIKELTMGLYLKLNNINNNIIIIIKLF